MIAAVAQIREDVSLVDYHRLGPWGSSSLKAMRKGPPARVLWERENPNPGTDATKLGTAAHCRFLTPDLFDAGNVLKPDGMEFRTNEAKRWRDDHLNAGRLIWTQDKMDLIRAICEALSAKSAVRDSLAQAELVEATLLWTDPETGAPCKARPDWVEGGFIYDLKVSRHAEAGTWLAARAFAEGWMHQLAHYRTGARANGLDVDGGRLVVVAPKAPHFVWGVEVKTDSLDLLALENASTLRAMHACHEAGVWPGTPDDWTKVEPPPAALAEVIGIAEPEEV